MHLSDFEPINSQTFSICVDLGAVLHRLLDLPVDRNIKRGVTALSAQYSSSRRVRTREASRDRPEHRALRLPVNAHLRWLYVHREDLDLGAVQTAATGCSKMMFLIGLVLRHHSAGKANIRAAVRLRRSSCLLVLQDTLRVRHIRLATSLWRKHHDFLFFFDKLNK